jgi:hypothetical protein
MQTTTGISIMQYINELVYILEFSLPVLNYTELYF